MKNYLTIIIIFSLIGVSLYLLLIKEQRFYPENQENLHNIEPGKLPPLGNPEAPVKIIEFGDFLCSFCGQTVLELYPQIENLIEEGKVVLYFRDFVIHPEAIIIHNASRCANEEGKYWEFNKLAFKNLINGIQTTRKDILVNLAKDINLDLTKFENCLKENRYLEEIRNDTQYGLKIGIKGTPTFFINGKKIVGFDIKKIRSTINQLLSTK